MERETPRAAENSWTKQVKCIDNWKRGNSNYWWKTSHLTIAISLCYNMGKPEYIIQLSQHSREPTNSIYTWWRRVITLNSSAPDTASLTKFAPILITQLGRQLCRVGSWTSYVSEPFRQTFSRQKKTTRIKILASVCLTSSKHQKYFTSQIFKPAIGWAYHKNILFQLHLLQHKGHFRFGS